MTEAVSTLGQRDRAYLAHPYTNLKAHADAGPLVISRGQGVRIYDEAGKEYIEGMAGLWCTSLGWGQERLVQAAAETMRRLSFYHSFSGRVPDVTVQLAERLIQLAPVPMSKVLFAGSGSESNDTAVKLIWYYNNALGRPKKKKIVARQKAYHGVTVATGSLTGLPMNHRDFDLPIPGILHVGCPHHYRFAKPGETEEEFSTRLAEELETTILAEGPDTVAAFFAEPVMGAGGVIVPPAGYFPKIQAVLKKYDVLFVVDEVICGFHRTGNRWGSETFGIKPDLLTTAKALSSGYAPISALLIAEPIWQAMVAESAKIGIFGHGYTYGGHPVSAAVALETLNIYDEVNILGHVRAVSPVLQEGLRSFAGHPLVGEVRGVGLVGAVELVRDKETRTPFDPAAGVGGALVRHAQAHGLILRPLGDSIAFSPPLVIGAEDIGEILARFGRALDETRDWVNAQGLV